MGPKKLRTCRRVSIEVMMLIEASLGSSAQKLVT